MNSLIIGHIAGLALALVAQLILTGNHAALDARFGIAAVVGMLVLILVFSWVREFAVFKRELEPGTATGSKKAAFAICALGGAISYVLIWSAGTISGYAAVTVLVLSPLVSLCALKLAAKWRNRSVAR